MGFGLSLFEEGSTGHEHQTFLVFHLFPEVGLEGVHAHAHLQHLGIQLGNCDIVSLLHLVTLGV
jgi:hypothetical protein